MLEWPPHDGLRDPGQACPGQAARPRPGGPGRRQLRDLPRVGQSRRARSSRRPARRPPGPGGERGREAPRLPPVRLAPREELAGSARVAPLLRAAREVARWLGPGGRALAENGRLPPAEAAAAMAELELAPGELDAAWRVSARSVV